MFSSIKSDIYASYKPLRNHIRKVSIDDSLYVIWSYIQYLQLNIQFQKDIEVSHNFLYSAFPEKGIYPWELETLTREVLINAYEGTSGKETFRKFSYMAQAINKLKMLEDDIARTYGDRSNILAELFRVGHRQFQWQARPNSKLFARYYKIFNQPDLNLIVQEKTQLSVEEIYLIAHALVGAYLQSPAIQTPLTVSINVLDNNKVETFIRLFSIDLSELRKILQGEQEYNEKYAYSYSSLRAFPLIRMLYRQKPCLVCPLPTLLIWRITSGLYYEVYKSTHFGHHFGHSFQAYVGEVIERSNFNRRFTIVPEESYRIGHKEKHTADWIINDENDNSAIFVECKTKRMIMPARIELFDEEPISDELRKMAKSVVQVYKAIEDYARNHYESFKYVEGRSIYPLIITLEDWHLFGDRLISDLQGFIVKELTEEGLPKSCLDTMPYSICSISEFEEIIQIIQMSGIDAFMKGKAFDSDINKWQFHGYIRSKYVEELKRTRFLFADEYHNIFSKIDLP